MANTKKRPNKNKYVVSPNERHRWLDKLEQGIGITAIAKQASRDIRIVKRHIEIAREERLRSRVRHDHLLRILEKHYEDLFSVADRLESMVGMFPPGDLLPSEAKQRKLHNAFLDHVKQAKISNLLMDYNQIVEEFREELARIESKLASIEAEFLKGMPVEVAPANWPKMIIEALESGLPLDKLSDQPYNQEKTSGDKYQVIWQANWLMASLVTEAQANTVIHLHRQFVSESKKALSELPKHRQLLKQVGDDVRDELDSLRLKRLIPGHCEFCPF